MTADKVIYSKRICCVGQQKGMKQQEELDGMIAIQNSQIIYVGNCDGGREYLGDNTEVLNLESKKILPGLIERHVHLLTKMKQYRDLGKSPLKVSEAEWLKILNAKTEQLIEEGITSVLDVEFLEDACDGDIRIFYRYSQQPGKKVRVHYACSFAKKGQVEYYRRLQNDYLKFWGIMDIVENEDELRKNMEWAYRQGISVRIKAENQEELDFLLNTWNVCRKKYGGKQLQNGIVYGEIIQESQKLFMKENHIAIILSNTNKRNFGTAQEIGREELGTIEKGMKADLVAINTWDDSIYLTMLDGQVVRENLQSQVG